MSRVLINKLKEALNSKKPIEEIKEIISEYEELYRLVEWRKEIISSGSELNKYNKEINRIANEMKKNGFYPELCGCDVEKSIIEYLNNFEDNEK